MSSTPPPAGPTASRPLLQGRLLAFAAILIAAFNLRTAVTSLTPLLEQLGQVFGFGATMTGVLGMVPTAAFALFGVSTPALARRIGLERTALVAMALATVGLLARSLAGSTGGLLLGSAIALAGMGIGNVVVPPMVKRYFPDRVGTVSTLYITVLQIGTMLPALLAVPLADAAGWRVSLGVWALISAFAMLPLIWLKPGAHAAQPAATPHTTVRVWRTPLGWGLALMFGMTSLVSYSMFTWLPRLLVDAGATPAFGGAMVALFSALGLVSALTMPAIAVRVSNPFPIVVFCFVSLMAAFAGLLWAPLKAPLLWVALLGLGPSTFPLALTLINLRTRTAAGSSALSGFMQGVGYSFSCVGPLLFGLLHSWSGTWASPFAFLVVCSAILLAASWVACKPQKLEDQQ
ncbi:MAG: CynX/NimT family MFS transporter [Stenotrophomonas sp.]